ncbi:MAG: carbamoyltransferase HypF [Ignavibacteriae bacterium]|nr:carbamoyltransferase HypF [Ignavibacteriota bacterium]
MISRTVISIRGAVQGVGFRPFIFRLANEMKLNGYIKNNSIGVLIEAEGEKKILDNFIIQIREKKPALSKITGFEFSFFEKNGYTSFNILESEETPETSAFILPDIAICDACIREMNDPADRRYIYPFINCTNCGPRFSIVEAIPYDRKNTTMKTFKMCPDCQKEYDNPNDRRYHAQPIACPVCGPHVEMWDGNGNVIESHHNAIHKLVELVKEGKIAAVKGIGGFHLVCDARGDEAVINLRERKHRIDKPFALMFPTLESIKEVCYVNQIEETLLRAPESPIVLLKRKSVPVKSVSDFCAPGNPELGVMLPYSPLHHLLMKELKNPIIATSANISEEPICIDELEALNRLKNIADYFLVHNRPVKRQIDDSVVRVVKGKVMMLRRARGYAPLPIELESDSNKIIFAVGGQLKNSIALKIGKNVFLSQHIGDLETQEATKAFANVIDDFRILYKVEPELIVKDLHPDYYSTKFAENINIKSKSIQHHIAHIASCKAENQVKGCCLGISWDGTGYGIDKTIWGGEFFRIDDVRCEHIGTFRQFPLPGGEIAIREPRRSALGLLYDMYGGSAFNYSVIQNNFSFEEINVLEKMLSNRTNCPLTSSVGRLFDAVASILNINQKINFEGQAAMNLEFTASANETRAYNYYIYNDSIFRIDWQTIIEELLMDVNSGVKNSIISAKFHNTLIEIILELAKLLNEEKIVLSGGCFQNTYLLNGVIEKLEQNNFKVYWHQRVPANDGGISLGQIAASELIIDNYNVKCKIGIRK